MGKYRLEECKRRVTERREETDIMRERGETKRETVHLSRETASMTVSHSRIKCHASICWCWEAIFFQNGNQLWFAGGRVGGTVQIKLSYYKQTGCNYTWEEEAVCLLKMVLVLIHILAGLLRFCFSFFLKYVVLLVRCEIGSHNGYLSVFEIIFFSV